MIMMMNINRWYWWLKITDDDDKTFGQADGKGDSYTTIPPLTLFAGVINMKEVYRATQMTGTQHSSDGGSAFEGADATTKFSILFSEIACRSWDGIPVSFNNPLE